MKHEIKTKKGEWQHTRPKYHTKSTYGYKKEKKIVIKLKWLNMSLVIVARQKTENWFQHLVKFCRIPRDGVSNSFQV